MRTIVSVSSIRFALVSIVGAALVACFPVADVLGHGGGGGGGERRTWWRRGGGGHGGGMGGYSGGMSGFSGGMPAADTAAGIRADTVIADFRAVLTAATPTPDRPAWDRTDRQCLRIQDIPARTPVRILDLILVHIPVPIRAPYWYGGWGGGWGWGDWWPWYDLAWWPGYYNNYCYGVPYAGDVYIAYADATPYTAYRPTDDGTTIGADGLPMPLTKAPARWFPVQTRRR